MINNIKRWNLRLPQELAVFILAHSKDQCLIKSECFLPSFWAGSYEENSRRHRRIWFWGHSGEWRWVQHWVQQRVNHRTNCCNQQDSEEEWGKSAVRTLNARQQMAAAALGAHSSQCRVLLCLSKWAECQIWTVFAAELGTELVASPHWDSGGWDTHNIGAVQYVDCWILAVRARFQTPSG